jgi:hypothetical protein
MPTLLIIVLSLHVLAATFWAGTTFALARTQGVGGRQLFRPQMGAAVITFLAGAYVWHQLHEAAFGRAERVLVVGVLFALAAAGVQGAMTGRALRRQHRGELTEAEAAQRTTLSQRIASGFLMVTIVTMVAARFL